MDRSCVSRCRMVPPSLHLTSHRGTPHHTIPHRTTPSRTSSSSPSNRFVIPTIRIAESEVVHAALGCSSSLERAQHHIHDSLRGEYVSTNDSGLGGWVEQRSARDADVDRVQASLRTGGSTRVSSSSFDHITSHLIERNVLSHQTAQGVDHCTVRHGRRCVEISE